MAKILVIDDDARQRRLIVYILTKAGHQVFEADDGREGLQLFHQQRPALVITDILMPNKEGIETIAELRGEAPEVAIIAMSGGGAIGDMSYLDVARTLGANDVITKPFSAPDLVEAVNRLLSAPP